MWITLPGCMGEYRARRETVQALHGCSPYQAKASTLSSAKTETFLTQRAKKKVRTERIKEKSAGRSGRNWRPDPEYSIPGVHLGSATESRAMPLAPAPPRRIVPAELVADLSRTASSCPRALLPGATFFLRAAVSPSGIDVKPHVAVRAACPPGEAWAGARRSRPPWRFDLGVR